MNSKNNIINTAKVIHILEINQGVMRLLVSFLSVTKQPHKFKWQLLLFPHKNDQVKLIHVLFLLC
jgi:hypothetical protein